MEYEEPDYVQKCWMETTRQSKGIFQRDPNQTPSKPVQRSQLAMKKVMDVTMKDRKMTEWSYSSQHGGLIRTQPETLKEATLSDHIPILSEIRYRVPDHIKECHSSHDYPCLADTFLYHDELKNNIIDLSTIKVACQTLAGNINIMQRKLNDDDNDTPKLFNGSSFIPAKDVISPEDDPALVDYGDNDE